MSKKVKITVDGRDKYISRESAIELNLIDEWPVFSSSSEAIIRQSLEVDECVTMIVDGWKSDIDGRSGGSDSTTRGWNVSKNTFIEYCKECIKFHKENE